MSLKTILKSILPASAVARVTALRRARHQASFDGLDTKQVFARIYRDQLWGDDGGRGYSSGAGSHDETVVAPYVAALRTVFVEIGPRPDVVDLGCGDFAVGSQTRDCAGRYVACDIVDDVIAENARIYSALDVDFRVLDLSVDDLPKGDVVVIRQVLQHLSNAHIARTLPKLTQYKYAIVTEHLPAGAFVSNADKPAGPGIRIDAGSGVVITDAPFDFIPRAERVICEVPYKGDLVRTTLYKLA